MSVSKTVVISCAGMGKRLGIGTTKCLVDVNGKSIIRRHLEMLDDIDDVRVVVGYQADRVIDAVNSYRRDVIFVFNHDYMHNQTGASVSLAAAYAGDYVLTLDGDLLIHPADMKRILKQQGEFIGVTAPGTDNPVLASVHDGRVVEFSREYGQFEWTGVSQISSSRNIDGSGHVYQVLEPYLPMDYLYIRTKEIDTMNDYEKAVHWVKNGFSDSIVVGILGSFDQDISLCFMLRLTQAFDAELAGETPRLLYDSVSSCPDDTDDTRHRSELFGAAQGMLNAGATTILSIDDPFDDFELTCDERSSDIACGIADIASLCAKELQARSEKQALFMTSQPDRHFERRQAVLAVHGIKISPADILLGDHKKLDAQDLAAAIEKASDDMSLVIDPAISMSLWKAGITPGDKIVDPLQLFIDSLLRKQKASRDFTDELYPEK